jgi:hypothetical protein
MNYPALAGSGNDVNERIIPCVCLMYWVKARNAQSKYTVSCLDSKPLYSAYARSLLVETHCGSYSTCQKALFETQSGLSCICQKPSGWDSKRTLLHMSEAFWLRLKTDLPAYARSLLAETQNGPTCICQKPSGWASKRTDLHMPEAVWLRLKTDPPAYARSLLVETQRGPSCICQKPSGWDSKTDPPAYARSLLVETQNVLCCICQKPSGWDSKRTLLHMPEALEIKRIWSVRGDQPTHTTGHCIS